MTSPAVSLETTILPVDTPASESTGADPYRESHLDPDVWASRGYDRASAESYTDTIKETHRNPNGILSVRRWLNLLQARSKV